MAWILSDSDIAGHASNPSEAFTDGTYLFVIDISFVGYSVIYGIVVYRIDSGSLTYLFTEDIGAVNDIHFDGTYLACACINQGIKIYSFSESGLTFIDQSYDLIPPEVSNPYATINKNETGDIWHVICSPGGIQTYELSGGSLTRLASLHITGSPFGVRSANDVIYVGCGSGGSPSLLMYEFTGSSYNLLDSKAFSTSDTWATVRNTGNKVWFCNTSLGVRLFEHDLIHDTLSEIDSINKGYCWDISTNNTTCFDANDAGNFGYEYISGNIVEVESDVTYANTYLFRSVSSTERWVVYTLLLSPNSPSNGVLLYDLGIPTPIEADFTSDVQSGYPPLTVNFTDESSGAITHWNWDFGDGTPSSSLQNPQHIYTTSGKYTVTLTVDDGVTFSVETKVDYITVNLEADFAPNKRVAIINSTIDFFDLTIGTPSTWQWDFGDGSSISTLQNPSHLYDSPGIYTISLTVVSENLSDTETKTDYIVIYELSFLEDNIPAVGFVRRSGPSIIFD